MEFIGKIAINKGWSDDKKYCVTDKNYQKYFLRVSEKEKLDSKKFEFDMMEKVASLGVSMCKGTDNIGESTCLVQRQYQVSCQSNG